MNNITIKDPYMSIEEIETNVFEEFSEIVREVSKEINREIFSSTVQKKINELLKEMEMKTNNLSSSAKEVVEVSRFLNDSKELLYESIEENIYDVVQEVLEKGVLLKFNSVHDKFEKLSSAMGDYKHSLDSSIINLKSMERDFLRIIEESIYENTKGAFSDELSEYIFSHFSKIFLNHDNTLAKMNVFSERINKVTEKLENKEKHLTNTIQQGIYQASTELLQNKVVTRFNEINKELADKLPQLDQNNQDAALLLKQYETLRKNLLKDIETIYEKINMNISQKITNDLTKVSLEFRKTQSNFNSSALELNNFFDQLKHYINRADNQHRDLFDAIEKNAESLADLNLKLNKFQGENTKSFLNLKEIITNKEKRFNKILIALGLLQINSLAGIAYLIFQ